MVYPCKILHTIFLWIILWKHSFQIQLHFGRKNNRRAVLSNLINLNLGFSKLFFLKWKVEHCTEWKCILLCWYIIPYIIKAPTIFLPRYYSYYLKRSKGLKWIIVEFLNYIAYGTPNMSFISNAIFQRVGYLSFVLLKKVTNLHDKLH